MKMIPMPEPGDKVSYLGEGEPEHGVVVKSEDQLLDEEDKEGNTWQVGVKWDSRHIENSTEWVFWLAEKEVWVTT